MALTFAGASGALVMAVDKTNEFTAACAEQIENLKDELAGTESALRSVLTHQANLKLPDGLYLYLKESHSTRALNETRVAHAIEQLSPEQCATLARAHRDWSSVQVIAEALADNLEAECMVITTAPAISKKMPADVVWRPAPPNVVQHAGRFQELQQQLAVIRKHRTAGRKRVAAVQAVAEPIVQAYLEQQRVAQKIIQFGPAPATPAPALPPLPVMPVLPNVAPVVEPPPKTTVAWVDTTDDVLRGKRVMFTARTYTSRGKAPKLNQFLEAVPTTLQAVAPLAKVSDWAAIAECKTAILDKMLTLFQSQFQAAQGAVKKTLVMKTV